MQSDYNREPMDDEAMRRRTRRASMRMPQKGQDMADMARDTGSEYADRMRQQAEAGKEQVAGGMEQMAQRVREKASGQGGIQGQAATKVAEGMEGTSQYLREHSTREIWNDLEQYVKEHPMQAVGGAIFAGFIIGRVLR